MTPLRLLTLRALLSLLPLRTPLLTLLSLRDATLDTTLAIPRSDWGNRDIFNDISMLIRSMPKKSSAGSATLYIYKD